MLDDLLKPHRLRPSVCHRQHVDPKRILKPGLLVEHVREVFRIRALFQLNDDPYAFLGRHIGYVHNIRSLLCLHQRTDIVQEFSDPCPYHCIRNLGDDKAFLPAFHLFHLNLSPDFDLPRSALVYSGKVILIHHDSACGEIRPLYILHKLFCADLVIFHVRLYRVDDLTEVMGGDAGRHAHCNPFRAVYKEVGNPHRKHFRLLFRLIKIRQEIDNILIKIRKICILGNLCQAGLRITHGGRAVSLYRAEISVAVHQYHSFFKLLRHDHKRLINGAVAVGMVLAHRIAHDTGALPVRLVKTYAKLVHIVEGAPLHRFQPVAHVRERPCDDNAHGIIYI